MNENRDLVEKSYEIITDKILRYEFVPGSPISDFSLSRMLGISRTPIRHALYKLEQVGLVLHNDSGFYIVSINENFIRELYEARIAIEQSCIEIIIEKNAPTDTLRSLCIAIEDALKTGRIIEALNKDIDFHTTIVELGDNSLIRQAYETIRMRIRLINLLALASVNFNTSQQYSLLVDAIERKDAKEACDILKRQIESGEKQKLDALNKFGRYDTANLYNFISGCYVAFQDDPEHLKEVLE